MTNTSRRDFLRASTAAAALTGLTTSMQGLLAEAQDVPANNANGSIKDVEHVVILMMENRSFDHSFGPWTVPVAPQATAVQSYQLPTVATGTTSRSAHQASNGDVPGVWRTAAT